MNTRTGRKTTEKGVVYDKGEPDKRWYYQDILIFSIFVTVALTFYVFHVRNDPPVDFYWFLLIISFVAFVLLECVLIGCVDVFMK
jgi:hypothetical protein